MAIKLASHRLAYGVVAATICLVGFVLIQRKSGASLFSSANRGPVELVRGNCSDRIDRAALDEALQLGTRFLLTHQLPDGNFHCEYNWATKEYSGECSPENHAGAAWGLALIYHDQPSAEVGAALDRTLAFFDQHSKTTASGARYVVYPGNAHGELGTVALVALTHIDYLRGGMKTLSAERQEHLRSRLDEYLRFIVSARKNEGLFHHQYSFTDVKPHGESSPYSDGEALLALVKAARYLGREDLRQLVLEEADAGHRLNIVEARNLEPDSNTTKGYYQWSSLAYFELATSDWGETEKYGDWLIELADWMIDTHRTLRRKRNTAYAYEGIVPAYQLAVQRGDLEHAKKFACTIEVAFSRFITWQLGHSLANGYINARKPADEVAIGGVQNHWSEPPLRIDVTQHQMHAVILARRYYWSEDNL